ncbi:efflux RND transporter permease subunit, partial [Noviherbaspirillum sp. ST9]|uniref:efflux RND transporter permease subunit n=1 Tax=Noviherbaspirillum sp. ST9 TaxID=3401606 RepID=UPI003B5891CE
ELPIGYAIYNPNTYAAWNNDDNTHFWLIVLVFFIVYIISAILLESLFKPIAVVLIIPFSFLGVFLIFHILGLGLDKGGYAALLMVSALVTNSALYVVNDLNIFNSQKKLLPINLYVRAFLAKATPIIITTISAVLSLLPFMISGEDQGFWFTLSAGTIGGLLFSLLGTWLLLPLLLIPNVKIKEEHIRKGGEHYG